ncbi:MAG: hypothetical protein A3H97_21205 [Acidobacteria bacterium RIFCSPLOWO2_02_FULL_65_29]|nr:MAG: hypothetical protein A3H97_21205 [Acidobacteria bacterium RIFCSPLOWO2_02_FULL_65_29]
MTRPIAVAVLSLLAVAAPVHAQNERCRVLCAPELKIEPTFTIENLFRAAIVETLEHGTVVESARERRERVFELIFALDVPTAAPRIGLTLEAIFIPFGATDVHPFTGASAADLGRSHIRDNGIEIEAELNFQLLEEEQSGGWVSSHFDVVDQFSPAHRPDAGTVFTHKLDLEWDTAFHVFNRLPEGHWLRNVEAEVSLDYLATGLPRAGEVLGDERFLQRASPWSLSFVMVVPLAPLVP